MTIFCHCCACLVPGAELMRPSDQQRLKVAFSRATHDGLGIIEFSSNLSPSQLSLLLLVVVEAEEMNLGLQR